MLIIKSMLVNDLTLMECRYVTAGTAWLNGAFSKVAKAGQVAGTKTREKFHLAVSNLTVKVGFSALATVLWKSLICVVL